VVAVTTAVVAGAVANKLHNGGEAWVRLSWVRGLLRLGIDAWLVEQITDAVPDAVCYFAEVTASFGLTGRAWLLDTTGTPVVAPPGAAPADLTDLATQADLLVNISGHLARGGLFDRFRRRALVDLDPGFTQVWHAQGLEGARVAGHHHHFTVGELVGTPASAVPVGDVRWLPVRPPVVLADWPVTPSGPEAAFTTVASWRGSYGQVEHGGQVYGLKAHEFRKVLPLPQHVPGPFEIALQIHPADDADRRALLAGGWRLRDPLEAAGDPERFRRYVQASAAEFSVAQGIYVELRTGWFSDRTVRYLASGKPALVQHTGFADTMPVGEGLLAFSTLEEAAAAAAAVSGDYDRHAKAARALAEELFDSDKVLARFLDQCEVTP
jgi:hypothetical protein